MDVRERFLSYVAIDSEAVAGLSKIPSGKGQNILAELLAEELRQIGLTDVCQCSNGVVYGKRRATVDGMLSLGLIAHMDTYPLNRGKCAAPLVIPNFQGVETLRLKRKRFPEMVAREIDRHRGEEIILSQNNTLLGVDDKAGLAEIVTAMQELCGERADRAHGEITVAFVPDEEIGRGCHLLDRKRFACDLAYVIDGEELGDIHIANMSSYGAYLRVKGDSVFLGHAKGWRNAVDIAAEFIGAFPLEQRAYHCEGDDGFYHFGKLEGDCTQAILVCTIMEFEPEGLERKIEELRCACRRMNAKYGKGTVTILTSSNGYANTAEYLKQTPLVVRLAEESLHEGGIKSNLVRFRGCTDAAAVNLMGIPATAIGVGGGGFHSIYEWVSVDSMRAVTRTIVRLCQRAIRLPADALFQGG